MTIETIEQQLSATRETLAKLEAELAALKKPAVKYRPAEWPRDWGRTDAEFCDDGISWKVSRIYGYDDTSDVDNSPQFYAKDTDEWFYCCRVPILEGDEYREPILPQDAGKECEFSDDGVTWTTKTLHAWSKVTRGEFPWGCNEVFWRHARIRTGATE